MHVEKNFNYLNMYSRIGIYLLRIKTGNILTLFMVRMFLTSTSLTFVAPCFVDLLSVDSVFVYIYRNIRN